MVLGSGGTYTYTQTVVVSEDKSDVFTYTIEDADGEISTTTLTINIVNNTDIPTLDVSNGSVDEAGLSTGSTPSATSEFTGPQDLGIDANGETFTISVGGVAVIGNGQVVIGTHGNLTINLDGTYSYELTSALNHDTTTPSDIFAISVVDGTGDEVTGNITISITDDGPIAKSDIDSVAELGSTTGNVISGVGDADSALLADTEGADGGITVVGAAKGAVGDQSSLPASISGDFGTLVLGSDGTYTYTQTAVVSEDKSDVFTYTIEDADGEISTTTLTINVVNTFEPVVADDVATYMADGDLPPDVAALIGTTGSTGVRFFREINIERGANDGQAITDDDTTNADFGAYDQGSTDVDGFGYVLKSLPSYGTLWISIDGEPAVQLAVDDTIPNDPDTRVFWTATEDQAGTSIQVGASANDKPTDTDGDLYYDWNGIKTSGWDEDGNLTTISHTLGNGVSVGNSQIEENEAILFDFGEEAVTEIQLTLKPQNGGEIAIWTIYDEAGNVIDSGDFPAPETPQPGDPTSQSTYSFDIGGADFHRLEVGVKDGADNKSDKFSVSDLSYKASVPPVGVTFDYEASNSGDEDLGTVTIDVRDQDALVVGKNVADIDGESEAHEVDTTSPTDVSGVITGTSGHDILVGDVGGGTLTGQVINVALILDMSGSMSTEITFGDTTQSRFAAMKSAVADLLNELGSDQNNIIKVHLTGFNSYASAEGTYTVTTTEGLNNALGFVTGLNNSGGTNYEAALGATNNWFNQTTGDAPLQNASVNKTIFISDGVPSRYTDATDNYTSSSNYEGGSGFHTRDIEDALGLGSDNVNEISLLQNVEVNGVKNDVQAIGIALSSDQVDATYGTALDILSLVDSDSTATNITTSAQLTSVVGDLNPLNQLDVAGDDTIIGNDGDDIIFGDSIYTDHLGGITEDGTGFAVLNDLLSDTNGSGSNSDEIVTYVQANHAALAVETVVDGIGREGGDDILNGGAGNDIIYGQEGDDILIGGTGLNTLVGGTGEDTFTLSDLSSVDVITDFNGNGAGNDGTGDILNLHDLLVEAGLDQAAIDGLNAGNIDTYVKLDSNGTETTVSVSDGQAGSSFTDVATLNGVGISDQVKVQVDDDQTILMTTI
ncbi:VWA domain-containing protein [Kiloniella sp.]|uniref:VWA domain-containing protein n=1 Tax=Kiloniella sp. TaxID=1938587 RepID=UPI003B011FBF